jgi:hypothetical protein
VGGFEKMARYFDIRYLIGHSSPSRRDQPPHYSTCCSDAAASPSSPTPYARVNFR